MRMKDKVGIVVGAGQTPGETIGNGRAAAILLAREGAKVLLVDRDIKSAEDTAAMIAKEGGTAKCIAGDWTRPADCKAYIKACVDAWGRVDFLHNNVGIGANDAARRSASPRRPSTASSRSISRDACSPARRRFR